MKTQTLLVALTGVNLALLTFSLVQPRPAGAQGVAPVLRGKALEIVDDRGKIRASLTIIPADPKVKMPDGTSMKETVLLRLIDPNGRPNVKLDTTEDGAGMLLAGPTDPGWVQLFAKGGNPSVKLTDRAGKVQTMKP